MLAGSDLPNGSTPESIKLRLETITRSIDEIFYEINDNRK